MVSILRARKTCKTPHRTREDYEKRLESILQGEPGPFGRWEWLEGHELVCQIIMEFLPNGDHDLKPLKALGLIGKENLHAAIDAVGPFSDKR